MTSTMLLYTAIVYICTDLWEMSRIVIAERGTNIYNGGRSYMKMNAENNAVSKEMQAYCANLKDFALFLTVMKTMNWN